MPAVTGEPKPRTLVAGPGRCIGMLRNAVAGALDRELVHSAAQRVGMEREHLRRPFRSLDQPACPFEGGENMAALHLLEGGKGGRSTGRRLASRVSARSCGHRE